MRKPPDSLDAWAAYQRGLWHMSKVVPEDNQLAQQFFRQAIDLDPELRQSILGRWPTPNSLPPRLFSYYR